MKCDLRELFVKQISLQISLQIRGGRMKKYRAVIGLVFVLMCFLAACSPQKDAAAAVKTVTSDTVPVQVKSVSGTEEETTVAQAR